MDFTTFFDIYMRPRTAGLLKRDGIEFRYAAASLLIACSKSDLDEDPEEERVIREILTETFGINDKTIERMLTFAREASEETYLGEITALVNEQFSERDKRFIMEKLWQVAYADGRLEDQEVEFIDRVAVEINMTSDDVATAQTIAQHSRQTA